MPRVIQVAIETLGCKLNQAESETLARQLAAAGCEVIPSRAKADVFILNTCTVTHIADRKSRHLLRMAKRLNPAVFIVATGCYANRSAGDLWEIPGIDLILKNEDKSSIPEIIVQRLGAVGSIGRIDSSLRTRSFVKAQDGCNRRCSYCIVPFVRGREKSLPAGEVIAEIRSRAAEGFREIVLTGTEVGSYSSGGLDIRGLLERILGETGVERLRVSSLQPREITSSLLELWRNPRLCPHFHISLQSGSDSVLARMGRGYSAGDYAGAVSLIRKALPDVAITTDIIVGFPGETSAEFQQSEDFCREMAFARVHVFSFSPRPGTAAAGMPGQVSPQVKKERSAGMLKVGEDSAAAYRSAFIGRTTEVLWEGRDGGSWTGYTPNYIRVYTRSARGLTNVSEKVKMIKLYKEGMWAESATEVEK